MRVQVEKDMASLTLTEIKREPREEESKKEVAIISEDIIMITRKTKYLPGEELMKEVVSLREEITKLKKETKNLAEEERLKEEMANLHEEIIKMKRLIKFSPGEDANR